MGKMIIKEHNKIAYERIKEGFKHSNKVATVCATGTGKSYQALQLIEDNTDKHILYITSLKSVKEQFVALCKQELSYRINAVTYDAIMRRYHKPSKKQQKQVSSFGKFKWISDRKG